MSICLHMLPVVTDIKFHRICFCTLCQLIPITVEITEIELQ